MLLSSDAGNALPDAAKSKELQLYSQCSRGRQAFTGLWGQSEIISFIQPRIMCANSNTYLKKLFLDLDISSVFLQKKCNAPYCINTIGRKKLLSVI